MCAHLDRTYPVRGIAAIKSTSSFFIEDTATTGIYTLSLHDALPISRSSASNAEPAPAHPATRPPRDGDRKSTRLNSSHLGTSYAVFCLKKKKEKEGHAT